MRRTRAVKRVLKKIARLPNDDDSDHRDEHATQPRAAHEAEDQRRDAEHEVRRKSPDAREEARERQRLCIRAEFRTIERARRRMRHEGTERDEDREREDGNRKTSP